MVFYEIKVDFLLLIEFCCLIELRDKKILLSLNKERERDCVVICKYCCIVIFYFLDEEVVKIFLIELCWVYLYFGVLLVVMNCIVICYII